MQAIKTQSAATAAGNRNSFLSARTKAKGALFAVTDATENGPIMTGNFVIDEEKYYLSAFMHMAKETGLQYLALTLQSPLPDRHTQDDIERQIRYNGKLFRKDGKASEHAPAYSGFITLLPSVGTQKHDEAAWRDAPVLNLTGQRKRSASGEARIALVMAPAMVDADELPF